ncbi:MAG: TrbG/VirB9 family P-type conjugative transfer protein [Alphaproteobacteria bacterium]|nr:TrbG/VirB9 family P-type conjugative transfer protein [Alphaproteobacteria bacterium]
MRRFALLGLVCLLATAVGARAHQQIASIYYSESRVIPVSGQLGVQTMIEFGPDEQIENIALGDSNAWQITPNKRANLIFIKPLRRHAHTNMTVITDRRHYLFDLGMGGPVYYDIRFIYPEALKLPDAAPSPEKPVAPAPAPVINSDWQRLGNAKLLPFKVYDDGHFTYMLWPEAADLPAIFAQAADGHEGPVNFTLHDGMIVVEGVAPRYILRIGKTHAELVKRSERSAKPTAEARP